MNKDNYNKYMREYYHRNKSDSDYLENKRASARKSQAKRKQTVKAYKLEYRKNNRDKITAYMRARRSTDIDTRLSDNLRSRLRMALKTNARRGSAVGLLGCSIATFKNYMAAMFKPGMSWDNYGDWHIDHKTPLANFNLTDKEQLSQACHYSNLQPLWATENFSKGKRV